MIAIDLKEHVALVTGASLGLGAAIAAKLGAAGASVVVNYKTGKTAAEEVVAKIVAQGGRALAYQADVCNAEVVQAMIVQAEQELGPIDILVNNAGRELAVASPFDLTQEDYQQMLDLNLHAILHTCRATFPAMCARRWGRIINIATADLYKPKAGFSAYAASKAAMVGLSRNLALELGPYGITVNIVAPSWIATPRTNATTQDAINHLIATTPLGYQGQPEHVAGAVLFFASNLADFVSGTTLPVSGAHDF